MKTIYRHIGLLILILPVLAFVVAHKFYVSVTHIRYSQKEDALQITTRIFIDDLDNVLEERYAFQAQLATDRESKEANMLIEKYFRSKFSIRVDDTNMDFDFLGKKYDNDVAICYLEIPKIDMESRSVISIQNEILTDLFDEQQNVVHVKINERKKSFVLTKSAAKGMLNL